MYPRRRVGTVLSATRRHDDTRSSNDPVHLFHSTNTTSLDEFRPSLDYSPTGSDAAVSNSTGTNNRSVGVSFLSSSSTSSTTSSTNSSRSSSPSARATANLHSMPSRQAQSHLTSSRRQRIRPSRNSSRIDATDSTLPTHSLASSSFARCAAPVSSKTGTRSRRRALLRSPIFQIILSPDTNQTDSRTHDHSNEQGGRLQNNFPLMDNFLAVTPSMPDTRLGEGVVAAAATGTSGVSIRSVRSRARSRRAYLSARMRSSTATTGAANGSPDPNSTDTTRNSSQPTRTRSRNSRDSVDVRAAVAAVRSTNPDNEDDCVICLCEKSNRSVILPCMHTFCFDCIYRWLCINPSCPLCKRLAQRIIHSVLSDSEFTELLVSDIPHHSRDTRPTELNFDQLDAHLTAAPDDTTTVRTGSIGNGLNSTGFPTLWLGQLRDLTNYRGRQSDESFLFRHLLSTAQPASVTDLLDLADGLSYRWNPGIRDLAEYSRNLLVWLVNNAFPPRESSLLDNLLLRQLVYVFCLDSIPAQQDSSLVRDTSPNFLLSNESQQHRLLPFIRRELRVLAPWLIYENTRHASSHEDHTEFSASPAVTAPLLSGAPGLETETRQLDDLVHDLVQHFCTVDMSNSQAMISFLRRHPAFHPSLVPEPYLEHFATEVLRYARFSGTMEEYDSAVCLYRRGLTLGGLIHSNNNSNNRRSNRSRHNPAVNNSSNPHLAVYVASSCWPGFRPGFAQPQGLITQPLVNWLLQRLFVHTVSGSLHPNPLPGTGQQPAPQSDPQTLNPLPVVCHPSCLTLSRLSRALLEAIPPCSRSRGRSYRRPGIGTQTNGSMTNSELYPTRLLCQRVLSELIDQTRYSEALSAYFSCYNQDNRVSRLSNDADGGIRLSESVLDDQETRDHRIMESSTERLRRTLQPAISSHHSALRRLNGLILLFITRIPGLNVDSEDFISELLHMPLLSMGASSPTSSNPAPRPIHRSGSDTFFSSATTGTTRPRVRPNRDDRNRSNYARFDGMDWNFLRRLSPLLSDTSELAATSRASDPIFPQIERDEITIRDDRTPEIETADRLSLSSNASFNSFSSISTHPLRSHIVSNSADEPVLIPDSPNRSWRGSSACVVISSDSSDDGETSDTTRSFPATRRSNILTSDTSETSSTPHFSLSIDPHNHGTADLNPTTGGPDLHRRNVPQNDIIPIISEVPTNNSPQPSADDAPGLAENSVPGTPNPEDLSLENVVSRHEEPMEVDESTGARTPATIEPCSTELGDEQNLINALKFYLNDNRGVNGLDQKQQLIRPRKSLRSFLDAVESRRLFHAGRRHRLHSSARSRSPIYVDTSDSDCEVVQESIQVESHSSDSESSTCSSSSTSCSSRSSSSHHGASNRSSSVRSDCSRSSRRHQKRRKPNHDHHRCSHKHKCCRHRTHTCRHTRHKKRWCSCCHRHSKHHKCSGRSDHSRHKHHTKDIESANTMSTSLLFNRPSSPIVISDDDGNDLNEAPSTTTPTNQSPICVASCSNNPCTSLQRPDADSTVVRNPSSSGDLTNQPSVSTHHPDSTAPTCQPGPSCSVTSSSVEGQMPNPSFKIFEPPTVQDFYQFMNRFHRLLETEPPSTTASYQQSNPDPMSSTPAVLEPQSTECLSPTNNPNTDSDHSQNTELSKPADFHVSCSNSDAIAQQAQPIPDLNDFTNSPSSSPNPTVSQSLEPDANQQLVNHPCPTD